MAVFTFIRMSMISLFSVKGPRLEPRDHVFGRHLARDDRRCDSADLLSRDRAGRSDLLHEILVPLAFHLNVSAGAEFDRLDQIVIDIGVDAGFAERVEGGAG